MDQGLDEGNTFLRNVESLTELHSVTYQKTRILDCTAVITSKLAEYYNEPTMLRNCPGTCRGQVYVVL